MTRLVHGGNLDHLLTGPAPFAAAAFAPAAFAACCVCYLQCFHQIMTGIYFLQAMILCVLLVKKFPFALLIIPLIIITVVFHQVNSKLYRRPWQLMSLKEAAVLDARDHVSSSDPGLLGTACLAGAAAWARPCLA